MRCTNNDNNVNFILISWESRHFSFSSTNTKKINCLCLWLFNNSHCAGSQFYLRGFFWGGGWLDVKTPPGTDNLVIHATWTNQCLPALPLLSSSVVSKVSLWQLLPLPALLTGKRKLIYRFVLWNPMQSWGQDGRAGAGTELDLKSKQSCWCTKVNSILYLTFTTRTMYALPTGLVIVAVTKY